MRKGLIFTRNKDTPICFTYGYGEMARSMPIMLLIIIGGIGFLTWEDIYLNRFPRKNTGCGSRCDHQPAHTAFLIVVPAVFFYFEDFRGLTGMHGVWNALFQSVTTRTAGYNTADLTAMSGASQALMIILMLIGGAPGSTAGGMKTTTFAVMIANAAATFRRRDQIQVFHRRLREEVVRNAATSAGMYLALFFCGAFAINVADTFRYLPVC